MGKEVDRLGNEVTVEAKLTESGVKLKAKSRAVSGWDRFLGNVSELLNLPMERRNARIQGEIDVIEEMTATAVQRVRNNPELIDHFAVKHIETAGRRLINQAAVFAEAIEDLKARPPSEDEAKEGPEALDPDFLNRFERYAEDASSEELRAKWGKILAAEIRQPGRISRRTMRAVDEMPAHVAVRFEQLCKHRVRSHIIKRLSGELSFDDISALSFHGLIVDPGAAKNHIGIFLDVNQGDRVWLYFDDYAGVGLQNNGTDLINGNNDLIVRDGARYAIPIYLLTEVGTDIASIFDSNSANTWDALIKLFVVHSAGRYDVYEYRTAPGGGLVRVKVHRSASASSPATNTTPSDAPRPEA